MSELRVSLISTDREFFGLGDAWRDLLGRMASPSVFQTWEYQSEWWLSYGSKYELRVLLLHDNTGVLRGIAPLMVGQGRQFARKALRHLSFIGALCDTLAEYLDILTEQGWEEAVTRAVGTHLAQEKYFDAATLFLTMMPAESQTPQWLREASPERENWALLNSYEAAYAAFPETWESYFSQRPPAHRQAMRSKERKLAEMGAVYLEAGRDLPVLEALELLRELNARRWGAGAQSFVSPDFVRFHRTLANKFAQQGWLSLYIIQVAGKAISARYDFRYGNKLWGFQGGWDPEYAKLKPGHLLFGHVMRRNLEDHGVREFDFMAGGGHYQSAWATGQRHLRDYEMLNPYSWKASAFEQIRALRRGVQHLDKIATF